MRFIKRLLFFFAGTLFVLSVFGSMIGKGLSLHFAAMNNRVLRNEVTAFDRVQCTLLYNSMIYIGGLAYPEAADILDHYIYGKGQDLHLEADYLKTSPVVQRYLNQMRAGESRNVWLKQREDWRLSYAVNGFTLWKKKSKAQLSQHIAFSKDKRIYTDLNFYLLKVRIPDGLIHTLNHTPFIVYAEWEM